MASYRVTAFVTNNGIEMTCDGAEFLGDAYGREYATREAAEVWARSLQESVSDVGLDPSTRYVVVAA